MTWPLCRTGWRRRASQFCRATPSRSTSRAAHLTAPHASTFKLPKVSSSNSSSGPHEVMSTSRLEAFSDGVFAIAATLLILNVVEPGGPLGQALLRIWPSYVAYAVSFVTIGVLWINDHMVMAQIGKVDRLFLLVNI